MVRSRACLKETKLDELNLDDVAVNMYRTNQDNKRHTLDVIREELLRPLGEKRKPYVTPTDWEVLTMLTGETQQTLRTELIVTAQVIRNMDNVFVRLDSGVDGMASKKYVGGSMNQVMPSNLSMAQANVLRTQGMMMGQNGMQDGHPQQRRTISLQLLQNAIQQGESRVKSLQTQPGPLTAEQLSAEITKTQRLVDERKQALSRIMTVLHTVSQGGVAGARPSTTSPRGRRSRSSRSSSVTI